jgi:hypothetical protein
MVMGWHIEKRAVIPIILPRRYQINISIDIQQFLAVLYVIHVLCVLMEGLEIYLKLIK